MLAGMTTRRVLILLLARSSSSWSVYNHHSFRLLPVTTAFTTSTTTARNNNNRNHYRFGSLASPTTPLLAKLKKAGTSTVDNYQTVSVNCSKCQQRLFRYKKKNGTKSNLVKCYIERICEDSAGVLALASKEQEQQPQTVPNEPSDNSKKDRKRKRNKDSSSSSQQQTTAAAFTPTSIANAMMVPIPTQLDPTYSWECPKCQTQFARSSMIHGRPALKLVGGKIRMTKK